MNGVLALLYLYPNEEHKQIGVVFVQKKKKSQRSSNYNKIKFWASTIKLWIEDKEKECVWENNLFYTKEVEYGSNVLTRKINGQI